MIEYDKENGVIKVYEIFSREYVKSVYNERRIDSESISERELTDDDLDALMETCVDKFENLEDEYWDCGPNYCGGVQSVVEDFIEQLEEEHNEKECEQ